MSDAATQLIQAFSALSPSERYTVILELAKLSEADTVVTDDELAHAGDELFGMYDDEETAIDDSKEG